MLQTILNKNASLKDALVKLDSNPDMQTLFIEDNNKIIGTITDGDIRRGLINGLNDKSPISEFMNKSFTFLQKGKYEQEKLDFIKLKKLEIIPVLNTDGSLFRIINFNKVKTILPIDAVIMAGGKGMRLRPLTKKIPKPLLKIGKKEIISYNMDRLHKYGISSQHITVNYLGEQIEEYCKNYDKDILFNIVYEPKLLGTAGALSLINNFENDFILLMNSDLLTNIDYEDFFRTFIEKDADMMVASIPYKVNLPYAVFDTENMIVKSLKEKPFYTYYANAGIYLFKRELLNLVPKNKEYNATDFMEDVIKASKKLVHYPIREYWLDIGKHKDFEKAQMDIAHINWD